MTLISLFVSIRLPVTLPEGRARNRTRMRRIDVQLNKSV